MSLYDTISQDFKQAMKAKEDVRVSVLRMLKTALKNKEVEVCRKLDDPEITAVIKSQAKQRRDSVEQFTAGGRTDLVAREEAELVFLEAYLPKQLDREAVEAAVTALIAELGAGSPKDMGKVMKAFTTRYAGQADGKLVSEVVKEKLAAR